MRARVPTVLLVVALVLPAPAAAQLADLTVRVTPHAGLLTPADWFYYQVTVFGEGPMEWTESALLRSTVVGATAEVEVPGTGLWIRGNVLRTVDAELYLAHAVMNSGQFTPPNVVRTPYWIPATITFGSVDLVLPTQLRLPFGIQPYITAGLGGKLYSFDDALLADNERIVGPEGGTELMGNVGGGVAVRLPGRRASLDLQIRDAISEYWDELQHDVTWMAGLSWRLF